MGGFRGPLHLRPRFPLLLLQMYQAKLFENQDTRRGVRIYGASVHYHYVSTDADGEETKGGERMVQSTMTEMIANVGRRIECFEVLYRQDAAVPGITLPQQVNTSLSS